MVDNIQAADSHFSGIATDGVRQAGKTGSIQVHQGLLPAAKIDQEARRVFRHWMTQPENRGVLRRRSQIDQVCRSSRCERRPGRPTAGGLRSINQRRLSHCTRSLRAVSSIHFPDRAMLLAIVRPNQRFAWPIRPGRYDCRMPSRVGKRHRLLTSGRITW